MAKGYSEEETFTFEEIKELLDNAMGKTLGQVDKKHVFDRAQNNPKITGIAGDVIEQSVLGYAANSKNRPDILIDGMEVEVKTTGVRFPKKKEKGDGIEAKEPMSITAVSPDTIIHEKFDSSHFWKKLSKMLLVYYLYDSDETVEAKDYANFELMGYEIHQFLDEDVSILRNDWETVRDFIIAIQRDFPENPQSQYPRLSFELRDKLLYIDTAPKWPHPPRFRLKRSFVTAIVQQHFERARFEELKGKVSSFDELDEKLHSLTAQYRGMSVLELVNLFGIKIHDVDHLNKAISEQIIVRMFGGSSSKINKIDLFAKAGIFAKTICLNSKGGRTEDMKLFPIDFGELENKDLEFDDSSIYDYFMNHQILCILFEEKDKSQNFKDNVFIGFKRFSYDYDFIDKEVRKTWDALRELVLKKGLVETVSMKKDGTVRINPNGLVSSSINFPKSSDFAVFVRGSGTDSSVKPFVYQGIHMYRQYIWTKGKDLVERLKKAKFI